jgi:flavorubredoxin
MHAAISEHTDHFHRQAITLRDCQDEPRAAAGWRPQEVMMATETMLRDGVYWTGAVDWDRRLFDALIPLPDGTSYNAYLVRGGDKTALIDTVDPAFTTTLVSQLEALGVDAIDYLVSNHAEQDHSGSLPHLAARYPMAQVVSTPKAKDMLGDLLHVPKERVLAVEDGGSLPLGGRTLRFVHFPWVHWPETMLTYLEEDHLLFSGDLFGSHLAQSSVFVTDETRMLEAAKRYYAEIMMPFAPVIDKNLHKVAALDVKMIAPAHGPVHQKPELILDAYRTWITAKPKNRAIIAYLSMHESTRAMVLHLTQALASRGVDVDVFNLVDADLGKLAMALVDATTVVLGTPVVLGGPHPKAAYAAMVINALRPQARFAAVIGSYGWNSKVPDQMAALLPNLKLEMLAPVVAKGLPREETFAALDQLAATIASKHAQL